MIVLILLLIVWIAAGVILYRKMSCREEIERNKFTIKLTPYLRDRTDDVIDDYFREE